MSQGRKKVCLLGVCVLTILTVIGLSALRGYELRRNKAVNKNTYFELPADPYTEDPLCYLDEDFVVQEGFHTNLPIVILSMEGELADYKGFKNEAEYVTGEEPYIKGHISIIDGGDFDNCITDQPAAQSDLLIKKRGHTSYYFDKEQYLLKLRTADGLDNDVDVLGMGAHDSWILNGSMADKSMIRNYLAYRISSEISDVTPDSQFCEVLIQDGDRYVYQGLFLMMETVARDANRVSIDQYREKNVYTSYIIRRDRFTHFDLMLDTYGRLSGISNEWIGVKYPSESRITDRAKHYIENDFSQIEQVIYSDNDRVFDTYDNYIDINSFADYFLLNEYFGNYDAGMHSTYMYKNSGEPLKIGPVWDFDQAMNNYFQDEMETGTMAFQERPLFDRLSKDKRFVRLLQSRYAVLRKGALSHEHVCDVIDETTAYIRSAREREWYRWAADYYDDSGTNGNNYYLLDYLDDDNMLVSRFNDNYDQELYNIKTYLYKHGRAIQTELRVLERSTIYDTSIRSENGLFLLIIMLLFFMPSVIIIRKG
ncbi:MAG: CotH kinase family protein [Lachnospiraceae bacterium]|nr:CotH kinase family protein [Lachnospiraceae bacterium]